MRLMKIVSIQSNSIGGTIMYRGRRLRKSESIRRLVRETTISCDDFIYPLFLEEGLSGKAEIKSMPGVYRYGIDALEEVVIRLQEAKVVSVMLFGIPKEKDACGSRAYVADGIVQQGIQTLKALDPSLYVIADVCMCEYTDHGHCGILTHDKDVDNDETLPYLSRIALSYAKAGVDMIAPSDMMDGHIASLRKTLDEHGYYQLPIMAYSAKYASSFYGPFREAASSTPSFGDRKTYQMDIANGKEACREMTADIQEGADIIMVKPAMAYLDIIKEASTQFAYPICAYQVSGEYSMLKMAVQQGLMQYDVIYESLLAIKRAGASMIITYFALEMADYIRKRDDHVS